MFCLGAQCEQLHTQTHVSRAGCVGKLPPEHSTAQATCTDDTHSQLSSVQPPSTTGNAAADADDVHREGSILQELRSRHDVPTSAFETEHPPQPPKREKSGSGRLSQRSNSQSSLQASNGQHMLRSNTQASSSIGSLTGLLNNIRTLGAGSQSMSKGGQAQGIGGGQKQYPLSNRFYKLDHRIGEGASATVWNDRRLLVVWLMTEWLCDMAV